jgi:hypothetical protein
VFSVLVFVSVQSPKSHEIFFMLDSFIHIVDVEITIVSQTFGFNSLTFIIVPNLFFQTPTINVATADISHFLYHFTVTK